MHRAFHTLSLAVLIGASFFSDAAAKSAGAGAGSSSLILGQGQTAMRDPAFRGNAYQPGGAGGTVLENTNLFTGQPQYDLTLTTLSARGQVFFPVSLSYSGPIFQILENNNDRFPVGPIGVGWNMNEAFVAINHKGTATYSDDVIFCSLG